MTGHEGANGRLAHAAYYYAARKDWHIFPVHGIVNGRCTCNGSESHDGPKDYGKKPYGSLVHNGHSDATTDPAKIAEWWGKAPEANLGVNCERSGFIVIDVDPRNDGIDSWGRLEQLLLENEGITLPDTVEACTGEYTTRSGVQRGRHLFFRVEEGQSFVANLNKHKLPGIDVKHKGYVVLTPSRHHSGLIYEWAPGKAPWEMGMAEAPEELLKLIRKGRRSTGASGIAEYGVLEWGGEKIDIDALLAEGIGEGTREVTLFKIACAFANRYPIKEGHGRASVHAIMRGINMKYVTPPLDYDENIAKQVDNAIDFVLENPITEKLWPGIETYKTALETWQPSVGESGAPAKAEAVPAAAGVVVTGTVVPSGTGPVTPAMSALTDVDRGMMPKDKDAVRETDGGVIGDRSMSDAGNGRRIIDYAGSRLRYSSGMGWFVWNGEYWVPDSGDLKIREEAKGLPTWIASEISKADTPDKAEALLKWANKARARATRETAIKDAESDERIVVPISRWDSHPHLLGVKNGVIDLKTGALHVDNRELYITKQVQVAYSPGMTNVSWNEFLNFVTGGDRELARYLQLAAGYTLTGDRHHECLFLVYGPPGSGKSTFLDVLGTLLGSYRISFAADVLQDTGHGARGSQEYYMAKLMGRRMLTISELPESVNVQEDAIKRLTGDAEISGRNPGGEPFEFQAQAKLWIGTNHRPRIRDNAMWRRIRAIPFNHVPEKSNPELKPYLMDPNGALPAALSWAVEGAMMLLGSTERLPLRSAASAVVHAATTEYQASENRIAIFLDEETVKHPGGSVNAQDLWQLYAQWSDMRGEKPMTYIAFGRKLEEGGEKMTGRGASLTVFDRGVAPRAVSTPAAMPAWGDLVARSR